MLKELHIENFAIIDRLDLQLSSGLIIFTGETGAGKSIMIDAVEMLLGGRADTTMIRSGADKAYVEGTFHLPPAIRAPVHLILEREGLLEDPEYVTLAREIRLNGRNIARVNGRAVNLSLLKEIGEHLVDVHGQSEHLSLLRVSQHLGLLDRYAGVEPLLNAYRQTYHKLLSVRRELADLRQAEKEAARRMDMLAYQIREIEAAHLRPDEEEALREERNRLANAEVLASLTQEALQTLDEGSPETPAVTDLLGQVVHALVSLVRYDPTQNALLDQAQLLFEGLSDLSRGLRSYLDSIEFNPRRLDQIEERLELIHNLKRKYGETISAVLAYAEKARQEKETIAHAGERIQQLELEEAQLLEQLAKEGQALSQKRHQEAEKLARALEIELLDLQMSGTQFKVDFQTRPDPNGLPIEGQRLAFDSSGYEQVEFLIAPNPGEGFKPLVKIASGGETSRLMLALKNVLARADYIPTLIFDEIDQGIGGRVGAVVGQKLRSLALQHQVLCVTHLPQLAAYGSQHFHVEKQVHHGRTTTRVRELHGESRLVELAQMLGGLSDGTLQSAREILEIAEEQKAP
jgi:DNA repair protein RecN (Recombination protein N)